MHISFDGEISVANLEAALRPLTLLLQNEGLDRLTQFSVSFLGWRGDARCQIVNHQGEIKALHVDPTAASDLTDQALPLPEGVIIRDRPDDLEQSPFSVLAGRDD